MAASYKALRGRIHAIHDTTAAGPGQGPNGYNRYNRAPLPLVIGSASFAADDTAGLSAPIPRHVEEESWVSDEEDDLPLARPRNAARDASNGTSQPQGAPAGDMSEEARLQALLDDPLFGSSLPAPATQAGAAVAPGVNGSAPPQAGAAPAAAPAVASAAGLVGGEEDGDAFGGGFFGSVTRRSTASLFGGSDLGFGADAGGLFGGAADSVFGGGGGGLFSRAGGESLFGESVAPPPAPTPAAPTPAPPAAAAQPAGAAAAPLPPPPAMPAAQPPLATVGEDAAEQEDEWVEVAPAQPVAPPPPAVPPAAAQRKPGRCVCVRVVCVRGVMFVFVLGSADGREARESVTAVCVCVCVCVCV